MKHALTIVCLALLPMSLTGQAFAEMGVKDLLLRLKIEHAVALGSHQEENYRVAYVIVNPTDKALLDVVIECTLFNKKNFLQKVNGTILLLSPKTLSYHFTHEVHPDYAAESTTIRCKAISASMSN